MSAVLLEVIGMIRQRSDDNTDLASLRVSGLLIFYTHIEYFMSKPVIQGNVQANGSIIVNERIDDVTITSCMMFLPRYDICQIFAGSNPYSGNL